jgi:hypothetical protein
MRCTLPARDGKPKDHVNQAMATTGRLPNIDTRRVSDETLNLASLCYTRQTTAAHDLVDNKREAP